MRSDRLALALVGAVALGVRLWAANLVTFPIPEDTAYYVHVARQLLDGRGLTSEAIWSYQTPPLAFPRPAFEVWLPLPTFLAALGMVLGGGSLAAAAAPTAILGAATALVVWDLARLADAEAGLDQRRQRVLAAGAGLVAAVELPLVLHGALPDSTIPYGLAAVTLADLAGRILLDGNAWTRRLVGVGFTIGLAAWSRNEALYLGLVWAVVAAILVRRTAGLGRWAVLTWARLVAIPAMVAGAVVSPWIVRQWLVFGTFLPGQAAANALSVTGFDIFAYANPPSLARYLAQGPGWLFSVRLDALTHDLVNVLLIPGAPLSLIGLLGLPRIARLRSLAPLLAVAGVTYLATSLLFPVATTWGTFLHAAVPAHVALDLAAIFLLDQLVTAVGRWRRWTRPMSWVAPAAAVTSALLITATAIPAFAGQAAATAARYRSIGQALAAAGRPVADLGPVVTNFPIWWATAFGTPALALPNESPASVLALARRFPHTDTVVVIGVHGHWPAILASDPVGRCFRPLELPEVSAPSSVGAIAVQGEGSDGATGLGPADPTATVRIYQLSCP